jgi:deazaflavin-dependent oxidoreductase (nitroreductase family)
MSEPLTFARANPVQRALRRFAASPAGSWLFARVLHRVDRPVYRLTRARHTLANLVSGLPVFILTTTGARTGQPRSVPLLGFPTEHGLAVIASNFGQSRHPSWYYNLHADPAATLRVRQEVRRVRATEATGELRDRIWQQGLAIYPGWSSYARRVPHREIAVFVLRAAAS